MHNIMPFIILCNIIIPILYTGNCEESSWVEYIGNDYNNENNEPTTINYLVTSILKLKNKTINNLQSRHGDNDQSLRVSRAVRLTYIIHIRDPSDNMYTAEHYYITTIHIIIICLNNNSIYASIILLCSTRDVPRIRLAILKVITYTCTFLYIYSCTTSLSFTRHYIIKFS